MLTGRVPFPADQLQAVIQHHFFTPVPDLRSTRGDIPEQLVAVIEKALAKEAPGRFATTREMLQAFQAATFTDEDWKFSESTLKRLTHGESVARVDTKELPALPEAPTLSISAPGRPRSKKSRALQAAAVAGIAVAVGGGAWWFGRSSSTALGASPPTPVSLLSAPIAANPPLTAAGKLRLLTTPPTAEILVDSKRVGVGSVVDAVVDSGAHRLRIQAEGFDPLDTTIVVPPARTLYLGRLRLRPRRPAG